ncbi:hypothetical protein [Falsiroseomonas sp. E2-1-a20]|uniref:hypothetical protein n=1 Tax=Falsiroseomonas sp. E2-1-a20 TaxID=3239300 RepID=UPI003F3C31A4
MKLRILTPVLASAFALGLAACDATPNSGATPGVPSAGRLAPGASQSGSDQRGGTSGVAGGGSTSTGSPSGEGAGAGASAGASSGGSASGSGGAGGAGATGGTQ